MSNGHDHTLSVSISWIPYSTAWSLNEYSCLEYVFSQVQSAISEREVAQTVTEYVCSDCDRSLEALAKSGEHERRKIRAWLFMEFPASSKLARVSLDMGS
jgi:hypothetical protein